MLITTETYNELRKEFIERQQKVLKLMADQPVECFRRKVYRLEDGGGNGPLYQKSFREQHILKPHYDILLPDQVVAITSKVNPPLSDFIGAISANSLCQFHLIVH